MRYLPYILVLLLSLSSGCGEEDAKGLTGSGNGEGNGDNGGGGTTSGLIGSWTGSFSDKDTEGSLSLQDADTKLTFTASDDEEAGDHSFNLVLPSAEVEVKGKFIQVDNESLLLDIEESTLSSVGLSGSTPKVKFKLLGRAMELYNSRFSILVKKAGDADAPTQSSSGEADSTPRSYTGDWTCKDKYDNKWSILIGTEVFSSDVSVKPGGILRLSGSVAASSNDKSKAKLEVEAASSKNEIGAVLEVTAKTDTLYVLFTRDGEQSQFSCERD